MKHFGLALLLFWIAPATQAADSDHVYMDALGAELSVGDWVVFNHPDSWLMETLRIKAFREAPETAVDLRNVLGKPDRVRALQELQESRDSAFFLEPK